MLNLTIESFDDALEYMADQIGSEFRLALEVATKIAENPSDYTGPQARMTAAKLASFRVKIGIAGQYAKARRTELKRPHDRLTADALLCMYDALEELIMSLKLIGRADNDLLTNG